MVDSKAGTKTRIWDIWIRVFHWVLALSVCFLLVSGKTGFLFFDWHRRVGELVLALVLFRLIWGVIGSSNARLLGLLVNPLRALSHIKSLLRGRVQQERGHNAAGGWAVLAMLLLITFQAVSGVFIADEDELIEGAYYGVLNADVSERLLELHYFNAKLLIILLSVHVLMIFVYLIRAGQNLITPMITGRMLWHGRDAAPVVKFVQPVVGLILIVICIAVVGLVLGWFK